jgi:hypothetical protein
MFVYPILLIIFLYLVIRYNTNMFTIEEEIAYPLKMIHYNVILLSKELMLLKLFQMKCKEVGLKK